MIRTPMVSGEGRGQGARPALPVLMLSHNGVGVPDVVPGTKHDVALHAHELRRAIAERATFGVWCDALAWHDVVDPLVTFRAVYGNKGQRVARRAPLTLFEVPS